MNLYSFLRKKHKSLFAGAFFAVAFFSSLLLTSATAHADYDNYKNLFSGKSPAAALKIQSTTSPVAGATAGERKVDLNFVFEGSFPVTKEENPGNSLAGHEKKWYWNYIRNFQESSNGSKYVFMLRICDTSITDENKCMFSIVPHVSEFSDDESLFCPRGGQCVLPDLNIYISKKIYHYTAITDVTGTALMPSDIQFDKFRAKFPVPSLSYLKGNDELDTPLNLNDIFKIGSKTEYKADIWYCGGEVSGEPAFPTADSIDEPNIRLFKKLCGDGHPYFKIAESNTFHMPQDLAAAATEIPEALSQDGTGPTDSDGNLPSCGFRVVSGSIMGCVAQIVYYLIFNPIQWVAGIIGRAFDFFLGYSISDESYRAGVIVTGWRLVRDISNIFFILILVWTGIATIFGISKISMRSVVPQLIINALLINFSLFGARVVIDISNVTARLFYNTMSVCDGECRYRTDEKTGKKILDNPNKETTGGFKPLSTKITSAFDPQRIMNPAILNPDNTSNTEGANQQGSADLQKLAAAPVNKDDYAGYFIIVTLIAAFIMFGIAKMFFSVMFMFLGRVVGLYMVMIFAPFAVMTRGGMPIVGGMKDIGWKDWSSDLVKYSVLAPIFVFFLYIIYSFINSNFMKDLHVGDAAGFMGTVLGIVIPMFIIYMLVQQGVTIAKRYAGKAGEMIQGFAGKATGFIGGAAVGIATGGAALVGRNVVGRLGARIATSETLQNRSAQGGVLGSLADRAIRAGGGLSRSTYDARNSTLGQRALRATGVTNTNSRIGGLLGANQTQTAGGFRGAIDRGVVARTARADRFLITGQAAATQDARTAAWEQQYQAARTTAQNTANAAGATFDEAAFRAAHMTSQATAGNARPQTSAEMNRAREGQNNARLQRGTTLARVSRVVTNRVTAPTGTVGSITAAVGAPIIGGGLTAAAAVVGQGAIQDAAAQQVARQRAGNARDPLADQRARLEARRNQLQQELTRRITALNTIGATFNPPVPYNNLTAANILDYQNDRRADIAVRQTRIDAEQSFIDQNQNNPAMAAQVNTSRATIRTLNNEQNGLRTDIQQANTVFTEFNRIQADIAGIRTQLGE